MQKITIIICKDEFFVFDGNEQIYFDGNESFPYRENRVIKDIEKLLFKVVQIFNLESAKDLSVCIVTNKDASITEFVKLAFTEQEYGTNVASFIEARCVIKKAIQQLLNDSALHIAEFGMNFDGVNYFLKDGRLEKLPFSLLGYQLKVGDFAKYI